MQTNGRSIRPCLSLFAKFFACWTSWLVYLSSIIRNPTLRFVFQKWPPNHTLCGTYPRRQARQAGSQLASW